MDKPVKLCGNCNYFGARGGILSPFCLLHGRATAKIARPCIDYKAKSAEEEAEHSTNNDRPYKSVKWPFRCVQLDRHGEIDICSIRPVRYDPKAIEDEALCFRQNYAYKLIDMRDRAIYDRIINAAIEAGIDDLYLMDKQFVLDALREKLERDYYGKIT